MDGLVILLDGPHAREAFLLRCVMADAWSMRIEDEAPLALVAVAQGDPWLVVGGEPTQLHPGDVALLRWERPYLMADVPDREPRITIDRDGRCLDPQGTLLDQSMALGVRTWGTSRDLADPTNTVLLIGTWRAESEVTRPLLAALPEVVVRRHDEWDSPLADLLGREIVRDEPGQQAVLDRMLDLLLVSVVRSWLADRDTVTRGLAHADPVVGRALRLMHHRPDHGWTIETLARECGVSRAALARRFGELVGEPPMTYLTHWRLALAADLLDGTADGIESIARQVGYGSGFALSAAFKRVRGVSPRQHRLRRRDRPPRSPAR